ncbi:hypothetical protein MTR67_032819 [Solanum verrucosum]|uniref:Uncharacterized protein n=1 Tax=Solanum verrucosum TaxID=315347 RepID=A0AAF0U589_SOLVR|nr:hypothetical protein MTR67_032819 [Solanum verrucosum]
MGWTGELHWASTHANSGSVAADIYRLSLACSIYALWHERNEKPLVPLLQNGLAPAAAKPVSNPNQSSRLIPQSQKVCQMCRVGALVFLDVVLESLSNT